jgi:tRNA threonylcarbamoyladenosine biosynthesis protein TsaE
VKGDVVVLQGELGAGKTEFVKGVCRFLAVDDLVTSPTFTIINQYKGELPSGDEVKVYHVDLYRIEDPAELAKIGFDDMIFAHDAIKLVEWPERAGSLLPSAYWQVRLEADAEIDDVRLIHVERVGKPAA